MINLLKLLAAATIWFTLYPAMILISMPVVAFLLMTDWEGRTTWFGNRLHGVGTSHYKFPTHGKFWREWWWLVIRNPVSNFGKFTLSVEPDAKWPWLIDQHIAGRFYIKHGWKEPDERIGNLRTFLFRPWFHDAD